nr:uncharacterized protein LOC129421267 isoform X2 [Misgurnus anguillicaudatus]
MSPKLSKDANKNDGFGRTRQSQRFNPMRNQRGKHRGFQQGTLLDLIISGLHPHTLVEEPGFSQFLQSIRCQVLLEKQQEA